MRQFVGELKATLFRCLNPLLPIEPPYAIVDVPNHANVGDSAIFLGELAWLEAIGAPPPSYICDIYSYRESDLRATRAARHHSDSRRRKPGRPVEGSPGAS